jgi:hypothetical protein
MHCDDTQSPISPEYPEEVLAFSLNELRDIQKAFEREESRLYSATIVLVCEISRKKALERKECRIYNASILLVESCTRAISTSTRRRRRVRCTLLPP